MGYHNDTHKLVTEGNSTLIKEGDVISDFRGESHVFMYISQEPVVGKEGKITVEPIGMIGSEREYYPSAFNLKIIERK